MVPVVVLAVVAVAVIRSLMHVVAREEAGGIASATSDYAPAQSYDPTVQLRARVHDDARGFLLPAATREVDLTAGAAQQSADRSGQSA